MKNITVFRKKEFTASDVVNMINGIASQPELETDKPLYDQAEKLTVEVIDLLKQVNGKIKALYDIGLTGCDTAADELIQLELVSFEDDINQVHTEYDATHDYIKENIASEKEELLLEESQ